MEGSTPECFVAPCRISQYDHPGATERLLHCTKDSGKEGIHHSQAAGVTKGGVLLHAAIAEPVLPLMACFCNAQLVKTSKRRLEQSAVPPKLFQQGSEKDIMLWKRREKERQWNEVVNKGKRRLEDILSDAEALLSGLDSDRSDASEEEQDASGEGRGGSATPPLRRKSTASPPPPTGLRRSSAAAVPSQRRHGLPLAAAGRPPPPPSTSAVSLGWRFLRFAVRYTQQRLRPSAMNAVANTLTRTLNRSRRRTQRRSMLYKAGSSSPSAGASPSSSMSALHGDASAMMSRSAASLSPLRVSTASAASNASPGARLHGDASAVLQPLPEVGSDEDSDNGETAATAFRDGVGEGGPSLQSPLKGSWDMAPTTWRRWRKTMKQRLSISRQVRRPHPMVMLPWWTMNPLLLPTIR